MYQKHRDGLKHKDVVAGKGSALYNALLSNDKKLVEKLYKESMDSFKKYYGE